jgi:hypothetical protein
MAISPCKPINKAITYRKPPAAKAIILPIFTILIAAKLDN